MKVIIGLGNPGMRYTLTRHNVGFWVVDQLGERWNIPCQKEKWKAMVGEGVVQGEKVVLIKPQTYMNLSGVSVRAAVDWLKCPLEEVIVVYDDLDLPTGNIRLRLKGSAGGHNGIKSIIAHLGTQEFCRIKVGIGRPERPMPIADYVLSPFSQAEEEPIAEAVARASDALEESMYNSFIEVMNQFNKKISS